MSHLRLVFFFLTCTTAVLSSQPLCAQESWGSQWTAGIDLVSSYIWRGARQGRGPHLQPSVEYSAGPFTAGIWGTFDLHGYKEVDLYAAVDLPCGFFVSLQDYYLAELPWADFSTESGSHVLEAGLGYESENVSLMANYIFNEAGGIGSSGGDLYFESRFSFDYFTVIMGAGNGWHTEDGRFKACIIGLEVSRDITVSDTFAIPVTAQMIYNPDQGILFMVAGLSLATGSGN
ncbi:MAG: hypothetical protein GX622_12605 [Bacteroidales bacterium]|nr:hypothetical protein [Bacteroidales bacterium]